MSKLYLYSIFHGNLNFSYIPKDLYPQILETCYWPLLRIAEDGNSRPGLEFSGYTLELLNALDPSFIHRLRELWQDGKCEVIGSGYTQSIMPLIPANVNRKNLDFGNAVYEKLLGQRPKTALLNELVYSSGLPQLYREAGYETLMINWESAIPAHVDRELLYRPCKVPAGESSSIQVLWHSLLAYRNFQRHVEGDITQGMFMDRLLAHMPAQGDRAYPLYCSDWEVFDFKPWRVYPEGFKRPKSNEMSKVAGMLDQIASHQDLEIVTPSDLMKLIPPQDFITPETPEHPLPYKKQALHSVGRWAVGGRSAVQNNTLCYRLYQKLTRVDWQIDHSNHVAEANGESEEIWRQLCFLWNSDFRTFTTEEKHQEFQRRMGSALERVERLMDSFAPAPLEQDRVRLTNSTLISASVEPASFTIYANGNDSVEPEAYQLEIDGQAIACQVSLETAVNQTLKKLTLESLPVLKPNQSKTGVVTAKTPCQTDHNHGWQIDRQNQRIITPSVELGLLQKWGGTIDFMTFPTVHSEPLVKRSQEATSDPVWTTDYLFAGDLVLRDQQGRTITDHHPTEIEYPDANQRQEIFIPIRCSTQTHIGTIWKTYRVYIHQPRVDLSIRFQWRDVVPRSFRVGTIPLNTPAWNRSTLYYATTNGGDDVERFGLTGHSVVHGASLPGDVTSKCCLGSTEAWTVLGDSEKGIGFVTRPGELYSAPMVNYQEMETNPESFLLSLTHTLGEWDETSHNLWRGHNTWTMSMLAGNDDIIETTRASALLSNGGLTVQSG